MITWRDWPSSLNPMYLWSQGEPCWPSSLNHMYLWSQGEPCWPSSLRPLLCKTTASTSKNKLMLQAFFLLCFISAILFWGEGGILIKHPPPPFSMVTTLAAFVLQTLEILVENALELRIKVTFRRGLQNKN